MVTGTAQLLLLVGLAAAGTLRYDQTQTGDTNIHLQIKNVDVLALLDDSALTEYDYDYTDMTEKPPKPGANSTWSTHDPVVEAANATAPAPAASSSAAPEEPLLSSTAAPAKRARRCGSGFHRDAQGRCRRVRRPNLQMLMNLGRQPSAPQSAVTAPAAS